MTTKELCVQIMKQFTGVYEDELTILESNILNIAEKEAGFELLVNKFGELLPPNEDPL